MIRTALTVGAVTILAGCAARLPPRPQGSAAPDATAVSAFVEASRQCRGLHALTAALSLSGRAGGERVRGRLLAGFETGGALRLEAVAPVGPPLFLLAGRHEEATLLLPRDRLVLPRAGVSEVLERLTGIPLGADDLRLVLSSCLTDDPRPTDGRRWGSGGWRAVTVGDGRVAYLREERGVSLIVAADYGPWRVDYSDHADGWPRVVRVRRTGEVAVDVTARLSQMEVNVPIPDRAFVLEVPPDARPIRLDELRTVTPSARPSPEASWHLRTPVLSPHRA